MNDFKNIFFRVAVDIIHYAYKLCITRQWRRRTMRDLKDNWCLDSIFSMQTIVLYDGFYNLQIYIAAGHL